LFDPFPLTSPAKLDDKFSATAGLVLDEATVKKIGDCAMAFEQEANVSQILSLAIAPGGRPHLLTP
jgi:hypothetical protein